MHDGLKVLMGPHELCRDLTFIDRVSAGAFFWGGFAAMSQDTHLLPPDRSEHCT